MAKRIKIDQITAIEKYGVHVVAEAMSIGKLTIKEGLRHSNPLIRDTHETAAKAMLKRQGIGPRHPQFAYAWAQLIAGE